MMGGDCGKLGEAGNEAEVSLVSAVDGLNDSGGMSHKERLRSFDRDVMVEMTMWSNLQSSGHPEPKIGEFVQSHRPYKFEERTSSVQLSRNDYVLKITEMKE